MEVNDKEKILLDYAELSEEIINGYIDIIICEMEYVNQHIKSCTIGQKVMQLYFRDILSEFDCIKLLFKYLRIQNSKAHVRIAFECLVQLGFMLCDENEIDKKATQILLYDKWKHIKTIEKLIALRREYNVENPAIDLDEALDSCQKEFSENTENYAVEIRTFLHGCKENSNGNWREWYKIFYSDIHNFSQLVEKIGDDFCRQYKYSYNQMSLYIHGQETIKSLMMTKDGEHHLKSFDNPKNGIVIISLLKFIFLHMEEYFQNIYGDLGLYDFRKFMQIQNAREDMLRKLDHDL